MSVTTLARTLEGPGSLPHFEIQYLFGTLRLLLLGAWSNQLRVMSRVP